MTTQAVVAKIGGSQGSRSYLVTATDGTWNNQLVTQTGGAQLGFAQTGRVINAVQVQYTAGSGGESCKGFWLAWVEANATSNDVNTVEGGKIPPIQIMQDDILEVYVAAVA